MESNRPSVQAAASSVIPIALLSLITFGIHALYWLVVTKRGMVRDWAEIPTSWLVIILMENYYWHWKSGKGVEMASKKEMNRVAYPCYTSDRTRRGGGF